MKKIKKKLIVICGPTASGKSALAVKIAKKFKGEIISADSRQIYRGLNLGSGKITKREMAGIPHYMLDVVNPEKRYNVVQYVKKARKNLKEIFSRGCLPIICGGTGFYISALVNNVGFPDVPPDEKLRKKLNGFETKRLLAELKKIDPARAHNIDQKNRRRIIRSIEIAKTLGHVPSLETNKKENYDVLWIGVLPKPKDLRNQIRVRLLARIKLGMIEEVKKLHKSRLSWKRMEELGLEYRYLARYLTGKISKETMLQELEIAIWHYARRQMTWFRREKIIKWFDPKKYKILENTVEKFLSDKIYWKRPEYSTSLEQK